MRRFRGICLAFSVFLSVFRLAASDGLSESDLDRLLYLKAGYGRFPAWTFFVFKGYDENNQALFEPFSGVRKLCPIPPGKLQKTAYFSDTEPYEIALDSYHCFYTDVSRFRFFQYLLSCHGKAELIAPMLEVSNTQKSFLQQLDSVRNEFNRGLRSVPQPRRNSSRREAGSPEMRRYRKKSSSSGLFSCSPAEPPEDEDENPEYLTDLLEKNKRKFAQNIQNVNRIIEQQLQKRNVIVAISIYLNMKKFWSRTSPGMFFYRQNTDLFADGRTELAGLIEQPGPVIIDKLKERYTNLACREYAARYPDARGLWRESPPVSAEDLLRFAETFYQVRRESLEYSPNSDFEKWGNCRLTVLLCTGGQPEAGYLENEFRRELKRSARIGNREPPGKRKEL